MSKAIKKYIITLSFFLIFFVQLSIAKEYDGQITKIEIRKVEQIGNSYKFSFDIEAANKGTKDWGAKIGGANLHFYIQDSKGYKVRVVSIDIGIEPLRPDVSGMELPAGEKRTFEKSISVDASALEDGKYKLVAFIIKPTGVLGLGGGERIDRKETPLCHVEGDFCKYNYWIENCEQPISADEINWYYCGSNLIKMADKNNYCCALNSKTYSTKTDCKNACKVQPTEDAVEKLPPIVSTVKSCADVAMTVVKLAGGCDKAKNYPTIYKACCEQKTLTIDDLLAYIEQLAKDYPQGNIPQEKIDHLLASLESFIQDDEGYKKYTASLTTITPSKEITPSPQIVASSDICTGNTYPSSPECKAGELGDETDRTTGKIITAKYLCSSQCKKNNKNGWLQCNELVSQKLGDKGVVKEGNQAFRCRKFDGKVYTWKGETTAVSSSQGTQEENCKEESINTCNPVGATCKCGQKLAYKTTESGYAIYCCKSKDGGLFPTSERCDSWGITLKDAPCSEQQTPAPSVTPVITSDRYGTVKLSDCKDTSGNWIPKLEILADAKKVYGDAKGCVCWNLRWGMTPTAQKCPEAYTV